MTHKDHRKQMQSEIERLEARARALREAELELFYSGGLCGHDNPDEYSMGLEWDGWSPKVWDLASRDYARRGAI